MVKLLTLSMVAVAACAPDLVDDTALVTGPRILAVAAQPPEARPGTPVAFTALWVSPDGPLPASQLAWGFCTERASVAEAGPVSADCLPPGSPAVSGFAQTGALPADGCARFGPDPPPPVAGQPAGRPADPDATGGFYQPVIVTASGGAALAEERIRCGLPAATATQASAYAMTYQDNRAPAITGAAITRGGAATTLVPLETDPTARATITPGESIDLSVSWDAAESYVWFDPTARELTTRREAIRVAWYATGGAFRSTHTGRTESEADQTSSGNAWTAPPGRDATLLWIVVRDDRGGVGWASYALAP